MKKIFDCHIHCSELKGDLLAKFAELNGLKYNLGELLKLMEENDVSSGLLLSSPLEDGQLAPNSRIIELCKKSSDRLFPVITVEPGSKKVEEAIELARKNEGMVKAFKILLGYFPVFADDQVFSKLFDYAESRDLPVMFHTGDTATEEGSLKHSHPLTLDSLANSRGSMKIVACHFGNPWIMDTAELVYKHPNVYADISGLVVGGAKYSLNYQRLLSRRLSEAIYYCGSAERVLFGTDYPVELPSLAISLANSLKIDSEDRTKIFYTNSEGVFGL